MKNIKLIVVSVISILFAINMQAQNKSLVVYFSHSNNTKVIAEYISEITGADIVRIEPVEPYPTEYQAVVDQAKKEINANFKPKLKTKIENIDQYDIIYVGSPNWWSTIAPPISTFLSSYNFKGKTIAPFITHEGSRLGRSVADIRKLCPDANIVRGYSRWGSQVNGAKKEVESWINELKY